MKLNTDKANTIYLDLLSDMIILKLKVGNEVGNRKAGFHKNGRLEVKIVSAL